MLSLLLADKLRFITFKADQWQQLSLMGKGIALVHPTKYIEALGNNAFNTDQKK